VDRPVLVDDVGDPRWHAIDVAMKTHDEAIYDRLLEPFPGELANGEMFARLALRGGRSRP
jgi:hypothetical protein